MEVICCGGDPMPRARRWVDPYGVPVRMYGSGNRKIDDHVYALGVVRTIWKHRHDFDLIYFLMPGLQVAYGVPVARMLGLSSVMKFSGSNDLSEARKAAIGPFEIAALRKWSDKIMVLNDAMVEEAMEAGFPREQLLWVPNPVDTDRYHPVTRDEQLRLRRELGIPGEEPIAIFIGRLAPEKELPSLVQGFSLAAREHAAAKLVFVGDGPMRPELEQQVRSLGLENRVVFAGMQNPDSICHWLQAADIFNLVSRREGLPMSLIEAMSIGLPSVVTDLPANTQLVADGVHGFHVKVNDAAGIGSALLRLLRDPELGKRFGAVARPIAVERFSTDTVLRTYEEIFTGILEKRMGAS
jgi:glycosyltransferase involved in cell wall biosynthesis